MCAYEHLKYPRIKCYDPEDGITQKGREASHKELGRFSFYHEVQCEKCGKTFLAHKGKPKYCSYRCRNDAQIEMRRQRHILKRKKHCTACGKFFEAKRDDAVFCSAACKQRWYRQRKKSKKDDVTDLS